MRYQLTYNVTIDGISIRHDGVTLKIKVTLVKAMNIVKKWDTLGDIYRIDAQMKQ